jgi:carboxypeptidase C (cathepsin A)
VISENRDILVERLEQKLVAKEREINELRDSIKESIVEELREGMKEDLDFDKRISVLENKLRDISLSYDGVMKELLDQKTIIQDMKNKYLKDDKVDQPPSTTRSGNPEKLSDWHDGVQVHREEPSATEKKTKSSSRFIIAESDEDRVPRKKKDEKDIIIAKNPAPGSARKGEVVIEAREDEDVVIEYKK